MKEKDYIAFGKPNFSAEEITAVGHVMESGWIGMGAETLAFEDELSQYIDVPHVVTVNSCTSGLFLSLLAAGVEEGDEVICPSLTWCSTANAALYLKASPIFCDIDPHTLCTDLDSILGCVTEKTRAVIVVHYGGYVVDVAELRDRLPTSVEIIEDAAHAFGGRYADGKVVGASGNLTCFSFYANKNLSTGEGGAIALNNVVQAQKLRRLRQHALPIDAWKRYSSRNDVLLSNNLTELGYKMNYTDLQACIGRVQLRRFNIMQKIRSELVDFYSESLANTGLILQDKCRDNSHAKHLFVFYSDEKEIIYDRGSLVLKLRERNIGASIHYTPLHLMELYGHPEALQPLPITERISRSLVTLPISASITKEQAVYVVNNLLEILNL